MSQKRLLMTAGGAMLLAATWSCSNSNSDPAGLGVRKGHANVVLRDRMGQPLTKGSTEPYSPRETCGACHDVDKIANGYHFEQGRTDLAGNIIAKDNYFGDGRNFLKSAGMYGKW